MSRRLSVQDLIDVAGGIIPLSEVLCCARTTVYDWKRTNTIPGSRIAQISRELSIPAADLLPLAQGPRLTRAAA